MSDTTLFYPTAWGEVRGIRDADGNETWIDYEDSNYPSHPTRVRHPNGWEVTASYDSNGLLDEVTDRSTGGVTSYEWDTAWSQPTQITSAEGVVTKLHYNSSTGNREWQAIEADTAHFGYTNNQLTSVIDPEGDTTTLTYDTTYGNLKTESRPEGSWTHYVRDSRGYITQVATPVDDGTDSLVVETTYDEVGRATETLQWSAGASMRLRTFTTYDSYSGLKTQTIPWGIANGDSITTGASTWEYDGFGRVLLETQANVEDSLAYDAAGNIVERYRAGDLTVGMIYDGMNRLRSRTTSSVFYDDETLAGWTFPYYASSGLTISAVTDTFTYDVMGHILTANNDVSKVTRTYSASGQLITDQQNLKNYSSSLWNVHIYDLAYTYDLDGRRTSIVHPSAISTGSDMTIYTYNGGTGRLSTITDVLDDEFDFTYNGNGQPTQLTFPGGYRDLVYDALGRMVYDSVYAGGSWIFTEQRAFDKAGHATTDGNSIWEYNGFGHVTYSWQESGEAQTGEEYVTRDAFGNDILHEIPSLEVAEGGTETPGLKTEKSFGTTTAGTGLGGRIGSTEQLWPLGGGDPDGWEGNNSNYGYYANGSLESVDEWRYMWSWPDPYDEAVLEAEHRYYSKNYYASDGKLIVHQATRDSIENLSITDSWGAYEEYWYDALGRRVLKRSRQDSPLCTLNSSPHDRCESSIERYVWDGDQILWEVRSTGSLDLAPASSATVGYIHAGGIDRPLGMILNDDLAVLHANYRGQVVKATNDAGNPTLTTVTFPGDRWGLQMQDYDPMEVQTWVGSLPMGQRDATGLIYQRNRYYDTNSGQFTQQDPIGIAGGLNLYGYANGDPVNFSDPFGLCPYEGDERDTNVADCPDDERKGVFEALAASKTLEAQTALSMFANLELDFGVTNGQINCGGTQSDGCTSSSGLVRVNGAQAGGTFAAATTVVHETFHAIVNSTGQSVDYEEGKSWDRALNFYQGLSPAHQASPKYSGYLTRRQQLGRIPFIQLWPK